MDPLALIIKGDLDTLLHFYQTDGFIITGKMIRKALIYRHFPIADFLLKSGCGCSILGLPLKTFPDEIVEMINNNNLEYESIEATRNDTDKHMQDLKSTMEKYENSIKKEKEKIMKLRYDIFYKYDLINIEGRIFHVAFIETMDINIGKYLAKNGLIFKDGTRIMPRLRAYEIGWDLSAINLRPINTHLSLMDNFDADICQIQRMGTSIQICIRHLLPPFLTFGKTTNTFDIYKTNIIKYNEYRECSKKDKNRKLEVQYDQIHMCPIHRDSYFCLDARFDIPYYGIDVIKLKEICLQWGISPDDKNIRTSLDKAIMEYIANYKIE